MPCWMLSECRLIQPSGALNPVALACCGVPISDQMVPQPHIVSQEIVFSMPCFCQYFLPFHNPVFVAFQILPQAYGILTLKSSETIGGSERDR